MKRFFRRIAAGALSLALCCGVLAPLSSAASSSVIDQQLSSMTLREKVGQLFLVRPDALTSDSTAVTQVTDDLRAGLAQYPVGGVALFGKNITDPAQLKAFLSDLQAASAVPMLTAVDEEGGIVARLANKSSFSLPKYQNAAAIGSTGDPANARAMGQTIGSYLKDYGFQLDFAPVADVNSNPNNPVIGTRAFSADPTVAAQMVSAAVEGFHDSGMLCTLKHFPGHGDTGEDSHYGTATTTKTWEEMKAVEILPFEAGIAAGADAIMTAHITTPNATTDGLPASLSYTMLTERLRGELGFEGVILTDALEMGAITSHYTSAEACIAALNAGADILLMPLDLPSAFDGVLSAVENGTISEERINASVRRVLTLKQKAGLLPADSEAPADTSTASPAAETPTSLLKNFWSSLFQK